MILTVNVNIVFSKDLGTVVDGVTRAVEDTPQHVLRHRQLHAAASELDVRRLHVDT